MYSSDTFRKHDSYGMGHDNCCCNFLKEAVTDDLVKLIYTEEIIRSISLCKTGDQTMWLQVLYNKLCFA